STDLNPFRIVRALWDVRTFTAFVVDGSDCVAVRFDQIDLGSQSEPRRREGYRTGMYLLTDGFGEHVRIWKCTARPVDASMRVASLDRIGRIRPFALYPVKIGQPRTVHVFIHHAYGQQRHVALVLGEGQQKGRLLRVVHAVPSATRLR